MKKLMIAAAIVCAAAFAQAASCSWKSGTIADYTGTTVGKDAVTASMYTLTLDQYTEYSKMDAEALSQAIYNDFGTATPIATKNSTATGAANLSDTAIASMQYRAILYVDNNADYVMGNIAAYQWSGSGTAGIGDLAVKVGGTGGSVSTEWVSVPEPTSGLLLLLGVAGLALRRRRA